MLLIINLLVDELKKITKKENLNELKVIKKRKHQQKNNDNYWIRLRD